MQSNSPIANDRPQQRRIRRLWLWTVWAGLILSSPVWAAEAYVRVNQIGYEPDAASRAYLMTTGPAGGARFSVVDPAGKSVFSAEAGTELGAWGKYTVYPLDFKITRAGTYTLLVSEPVRAVSPAFRAETPAKLYSEALANSLFFYQNQRDGPDFIRTPLRTAPAHLNDRKASVYFTPEFDNQGNQVGDLKPTGAVIDASGGWWDAGDYLKFVQNHSYVVTFMLIGARDFPNQMGRGSKSSSFLAEAKHGLDWLQKMWDDKSRTFYYQAGIGKDMPDFIGDHGSWRLPQADDTLGGSHPAARYIRNRPVFVAGPPGSPVSPNHAGRLAASLALCYQVFRTTDPSYADRCLVSAARVFELADVSPSGRLLTTAPFNFYPEREWRDDLELGATELYLALAGAKGKLPAGLPRTDPLYYLKAAAHWANAYIENAKDRTADLNLYDVSGLAHFELYRALALAGNPADLAVSQPRLLEAMKSHLDRAIGQHAAADPFGFGRPWRQGDTASCGAGLAVMAKQYAFLTGSAAHEQYARRWAANILGANAWGASFIVGTGSNFPHCIHHQVANLAGSLDGTPPVLRGAVVQGPASDRSGAGRSQAQAPPGPPAPPSPPAPPAASSRDPALRGSMRRCPADGSDRFAQFNGNGAMFTDNVQSYRTAEPAIDLSATSFLMFAWLSGGAPAGLR